ncbi:hypothetical protein J6590_052075 [Homalodisca vitripennis]|nr:hypothetical protein J6590_052075 [Homalodisca vitripennis]
MHQGPGNDDLSGKPQIIEDYNISKSNIDSVDQLIVFQLLNIAKNTKLANGDFLRHGSVGATILLMANHQLLGKSSLRKVCEPFGYR